MSVDLYGDTSQITPDQRRFFDDAIKPSSMDAFTLSFSNMFRDENPVVKLGSAAYNTIQNEFSSPENKISVDDLNRHYWKEGMPKYSEPISEEAASNNWDRFNRIEQKNNIISRAESPIASFAGSMAGGLTDPLMMLFMAVAPETQLLKFGQGELALSARSAVNSAKASFIPGAEVGALEAAGLRTGIGAAHGAAGMALWQPIEASAAYANGEEYGVENAIHGIAMGTGLGLLLRGGLGTIADTFSKVANRNEISQIQKINEILMRQGKQTITEDLVMATKGAIEIQADYGSRMFHEELNKLINGKITKENFLENFRDNVVRTSSTYGKKVEKVDNFSFVSKSLEATGLKEVITNQSEIGKALDIIDVLDSVDLKDPLIRSSILREINVKDLNVAAESLNKIWTSLKSQKETILNTLRDVPENRINRTLNKEGINRGLVGNLTKFVEDKMIQVGELSDAVSKRNYLLDQIRVDASKNVVGAFKKSMTAEDQAIFSGHTKTKIPKGFKQEIPSTADLGSMKKINSIIDSEFLKKNAEGEIQYPNKEMQKASEIVDSFEKTKGILSSVTDCALKFLA